MRQQVRVMVIGESPMVEGVAVELQNDPRIELQQLSADHYADLPISEFEPDVIVYESGSPHSEEILRQVCILPMIRLIGLDDMSNHVLVLDSRLLEAPNMKVLRHLIMPSATSSPVDQVVGQPVGRSTQAALEIEFAGQDS